MLEVWEPAYEAFSHLLGGLAPDGAVGEDIGGHHAAAADATKDAATAAPSNPDEAMWDAGGNALDGGTAATGPDARQGAGAYAREQHLWRQATLE